MSDLRKDPCTGCWVVLEDGPPATPHEGEECPFCAGNEARTPPEITSRSLPGRGPDQGGWRVRVVANLRPILRTEEPLARRAEFIYDAASGTGAHEIVIETPEHEARLSRLPVQQIELVLETWAERIRDLKRDSRIRSVFVFKNQGARAGALLPGHAHSQVIGLPVTPKALKELLAGARAHFDWKERCVFCDIVQEEVDRGRRLVAVTGAFVAIAPFASRHPYECWILPRTHAADFEEGDPRMWPDLATLLKRVLTQLERLLPDPALNLFLYSAPNRDRRPGYWTTLDQDFHWHIAILPRPEEIAGFEVGTGLHANPVAPEYAASRLREGV